MPSGVTVDLHQFRSDRASRTLAIELHNGSNVDLTIIGATYSSSAFASPAVWPKESSTIPAGVTRALRVTLADSVCAPATAPLDRVSITFRLPSNETGAAILTPEDPYGSLPRIAGEDCGAAAVGEVVSLEGTDVRVVGTGSASIAYLRVQVRPIGTGAETVRIERIAPSLLVTSPAGEGWPLDRIIEASETASTFELPIVPNRCDPHAVAEDKVGTRLPVEAITDDGVRRRFPLALSQGTRELILGFVAEYCGYGD